MRRTPSRFLRSASLVSAGTATGQVIAFFGSLVLVRVFSPEQLGLYTTLVAVITCLAPLASGRFEAAIPLPKEVKGALNLTAMAVAMAFATSSVAALVAGAWIAIAGDFSPGTLLWLIALPTVTTGLTFYQASNQLAVRAQTYRHLALRGLLYPTVMVSFQAGLGFLGAGTPGLIAGLVISYVVTALTLYMPVRRSHRAANACEADTIRREWKHLAQSYKRFPRYMAPAGAVNALSTQMPQIGIYVLLGVAAAGQFGIMTKILAVPVALIGQSVGYVYVGEVARLERDGQPGVKAIYRRLTLVLSLVACIGIGLVWFMGEPMLNWLLGGGWEDASRLATVFVFAAMTQLVVSPLSHTLVVAQRGKGQLMLDLVRCGLVGFSLGVSSQFDFDLYESVLAVVVALVIGYAAMWGINWRAAKDLDSAGAGQPSQSTELSSATSQEHSNG